MRILFLCSCLEPGRDGVGDYVRLLAGACARRGHVCAIAALNDPFVDAPVQSSLKGPDGAIITARFPSGMPWPQRREAARVFRDFFQPGWISLQLVPYAFHKRGILFGLDSPFRSITEGIPLHIMFHELWLGAGRPSPLRFYITGAFQRLAIRRLLAGLQPQLVTASNPVHVAMLRNFRPDAAMLPLFGNVSIANGEFSRISGLLADAEITADHRDEWWLGIFFGSLHPEWKPEPLMSLLERAARTAGKKVCLLLAGRAGTSGDVIWKKLRNEYGSRITFLNVGKQPAEIISALLQNADFGIAASPWQLIGKSGTVAAMLDHGLPVIVTRDDFQPFQQTGEPPSSDPLIHRCDGQLEARLAAGLPKRPPLARLDSIATQLCEQFEALAPAKP